MSKSLYRNILSGGFWQVNKKLAKHFNSIQTAIVLDELCFHEIKHGNANGFFYYKAETLEENCLISREIRRKIFAQLVNMKILTIERRGLPSRNWYKINYDEIESIFSDQKTSEVEIYPELEVQKKLPSEVEICPAIYTKEDINKNIEEEVEEEDSEETSTTSSSFSLTSNTKYKSFEDYFISTPFYVRLKAPGMIYKVFEHYGSLDNFDSAYAALRNLYLKKKPYSHEWLEGDENDLFWQTDFHTYVESAIIKDIAGAK